MSKSGIEKVDDIVLAMKPGARELYFAIKYGQLTNNPLLEDLEYHTRKREEIKSELLKKYREYKKSLADNKDVKE